MVSGVMTTDWARLDDGAALRRYAKLGDAEAFEVLVRRYGAMVLATCRRSLASEADAEDATQETFFKLATRASSVKSNVAAWLHRCAIGTSVDFARKAGVRSRAERSAGTESVADDGATGAAVWRDLEPVIDRVLSEMSDRDRTLIVSRYLAGRSQAEIARSMGVSEGTVSRRLSSAVDLLRTKLGASGALAVGGGSAVLVAALEVGARSGAMSPVLGASLGKIGLSGVGTASAGGGVSTVAATGGSIGGGALGKTLVAGAAVAAVGTTVLVASMNTWGGSGTGSGGSSLVTGGLAPGRAASEGSALAGEVDRPIASESAPGPGVPRGTIGPFQIITATDESFEDRGVWITDRQMEIRHGFSLEGESNRAMLNIESVDVVADDPETKGVVERGVLRTRVRRILPGGDVPSRFKLGRTVRISVGFDDFGRVVLRDVAGEVQLGRNEPRWFGVRPPADWPESARVPSEAGELGVLGPWTESERVPVTITSEEIRFGTEKWAKERYRVISWEPVEGWTRVLSVNGGGRDPRLIGTRFQLLLREDEKGYTMAYYPPGTDRAGAWPTSFEYSASNPVRVVSFETDGGGR